MSEASVHSNHQFKNNERGTQLWFDWEYTEFVQPLEG